MINLSIGTICGAATKSRPDGERLRAAIELAIAAGDAVKLDLERRRIASSSFLDEGFVQLELARPGTLDRTVVLVNMLDRDRRLLDDILAQRKELASANGT